MVDYAVAIAIVAAVLVIAVISSIVICFVNRDRVCCKRCRNWRHCCDCFEPKVIRVYDSSYSNTNRRRRVAVERWVQDNSQRKKHQSRRAQETIWRTPETTERKLDEERLVGRKQDWHRDSPKLIHAETRNNSHALQDDHTNTFQTYNIESRQTNLSTKYGVSQLQVGHYAIPSQNSIRLTSPAPLQSNIEYTQRYETSGPLRGSVSSLLTGAQTSLFNPSFQKNSRLFNGSQQFTNKLPSVSHNSQVEGRTDFRRSPIESVIDNNYPLLSLRERGMAPPSQISAERPRSNQPYKQQNSFAHPIHTSSRYNLNIPETPLLLLPSPIQSPISATPSSIPTEQSNQSIVQHGPSSQVMVQSGLSGQVSVQNGPSHQVMVQNGSSTEALVQNNLTGQDIVQNDSIACVMVQNSSNGRAMVQNNSTSQSMLQDNLTGHDIAQNGASGLAMSEIISGNASLPQNRSVSLVNIVSGGTGTVTTRNADRFSNHNNLQNSNQIISRIMVGNSVNSVPMSGGAEMQNSARVTVGHWNTPNRISGTVVSVNRPLRYGTRYVEEPHADYSQDENTHDHLNEQLAGTVRIFTCSESLGSWLDNFESASPHNERIRRNVRPPLRTNTFKRPALPLPNTPSATPRTHRRFTQRQSPHAVPVIAVPRNRSVSQSVRNRSTGSRHTDHVPTRVMSVGRTSRMMLAPYNPRQSESERLVYTGNSARGPSNPRHSSSERRSYHRSHHSTPLLNSIRITNMYPRQDNRQVHDNRGRQQNLGFLAGRSSESDSWHSRTHNWVYGLPLHGLPPYEPGTFGHIWRRHNFQCYPDPPPAYDTIYEAGESNV